MKKTEILTSSSFDSLPLEQVEISALFPTIRKWIEDNGVQVNTDMFLEGLQSDTFERSLLEIGIIK